MYVFQSIVFVFEILLQLIFAVAIVICSDSMVKEFNGSGVKYIISKIVSIIIALFIFIHFTVPYLKDLPKLITGKLNYSVEYVYYVRRPSKSSTEYVEVEGKTLEFFMTSRIKTHQYYKIGYLPNTNRGIYLGKLGYDPNSPETKVGFPFQDIFIYVILIVGALLLAIAAPFFRWRFLILSCILSYPVNIYLLMNQGIKSWLWVTKYNDSFYPLVLQVMGILFLFIFNFIERRKDEEIVGTLFFAQIVAIGNMGSFIYNILRW